MKTKKKGRKKETCSLSKKKNHRKTHLKKPKSHILENRNLIFQYFAITLPENQPGETLLTGSATTFMIGIYHYTVVIDHTKIISKGVKSSTSTMITHFN